MNVTNFLPQNFLLEDQVGIKTLQLHLSNPCGYKVHSLRVSRDGPEACVVRAACRDATVRGRPDQFLLQRANLGRADFDERRASFQHGEAGGVCVVRVPYGVNRSEGSCHVSDLEGGEIDPDDEGVSIVARLRCRFCEHPFTPAGCGLQVRAMPSGRWDDCIEDMICFDGPSAVSMLARDVNFASEGRCLMGHAEVLVHSRDVLPGAVAFGDGGPRLDAESLHGQKYDRDDKPDDKRQTLECARCELPVGRPSILVDGSGKRGVGLVLLKHALLGDGLTAPNTPVGGCGENASDGVKTGLDGNLQGSQHHDGVRLKGGAPSSRLRVFESRTAIKWLMGEMERFNHADGCTRFVVAARGRPRAAPAGCLSVLLVATHNLVSVDGERKPCRAHRVAFREESREEAERTLNEEEQDEHDPPCRDAGTGAPVVSTKRRARARARVLDVSYEEHRAVRQRLVDAEWASASAVDIPLARLDRRGYRFSCLF